MVRKNTLPLSPAELFRDLCLLDDKDGFRGLIDDEIVDDDVSELFLLNLLGS